MSKTQAKTKIVSGNSGKFFITTSSSSTSELYFWDYYRVNDHLEKAESTKNVEDAVLFYIKARKSLGHTIVNTVEIARNLKLPRKAVETAAANLRSFGVKKKK